MTGTLSSGKVTGGGHRRLGVDLHDRAGRGLPTVLVGPAGRGKSALLAAVAEAWHTVGLPVVNLTAGPTDAGVRYAVVAELFAALGADRLAGSAAGRSGGSGPEDESAAADSGLRTATAERDRSASASSISGDSPGSPGLAEPPELTGPQRDAVRRVLRLDDGPEPDVAAVRRAALSCLASGARRGRILLLADDIQWWDPGSVDVLAFLARQGGDRLSILAATRPGGPSTAVFLGRDAVEITVPPLTASETATLLDGRGIPLRTAGRVHAAAGGNARLVLELARGLGESADALDHAAPTSASAQRIIRTWLTELPEATYRVLLIAALSADPSITTLRRAAGPAALDAIAVAEDAGFVAVDFCTLSFPASAVRDTILADASEAALRSAHLLLADASPNPADRLWHAASAQEGPDEGVAHALANAAATVRCRGDRARAAELALLAAEMTPTITRVAQTPETPGRDALRSAFAITDAPSARPTAPSACPEPLLLAAALDAGAAGRLDLACTALARIDASGADPATRVHARIAVVDAIGQALSGLDALLAQALADAEAAGDPALLSAVHLRLAWHAHLALGENERARRSANAAVRHAELSGDPEARAAALVMMARIQQLLGVPECSSTLRRALALGTTPRPGGVVNSPQWTAVRFALFADRLDQARHHLRGLTPRAERSGSFEDLRLVLRAAVEIEARAGFGVTAQRLAGRLLSLPGSDGASPGPAWHAAALAELAGGRLEQALRFAELGSESSAQEHDQIFLTRSLQVSGMVRLLLRDAAGAADDLRRVRQLERDQGIGDPATIRYHADLAEAFVALGDLTAAEETITSTRRAASALGRRGVLASLDRAEGVKRAAEGDFARAEALLHRSERTFGKLGLPLERARVLLAQSVVEKRQRRIARSRDTRRAAEEAFAKAGAELWGPAKPGTRGPRTGGEIGAGRGGGIGSGPPSGSGSGAGPGSAAASAPARSMEPPSTIRRDVARASTLSSASVSTPSAATPDLTAAEQRVVQLVAAGCANREIAATLFLSVKTVESVLTGVYRKLGVRSRTQLCLVLSSDTGPPLVETG